MAAASIAKLLSERDQQDQVYRLSCELANLHAVQGRNDGVTLLAHQNSASSSDTTMVDGTPDGAKTAPVARRRGRRKTTEREVQTYRFERNGDPKTVLLEIGGPYGLFAKALRDAVVSVNKAKYWMPSLTLIGFMPTKPEHGPYIALKAKTTISARPGCVVSVDAKSAAPHDARMEPRNKPGGDRVMVPVFHERLAEAITFDVDMTINSECPRTPEEISGLLHAMQGVPFGPAKRGALKITKVEKVQ